MLWVPSGSWEQNTATCLGELGDWGPKCESIRIDLKEPKKQRCTDSIGI